MPNGTLGAKMESEELPFAVSPSSGQRMRSLMAYYIFQITWQLHLGMCHLFSFNSYFSDSKTHFFMYFNITEVRFTLFFMAAFNSF